MIPRSIKKLFGLATSPADLFSKQLKQDFKKLREQGYTRMLVVLKPDEQGALYYGPVSCSVLTIGVKTDTRVSVAFYNNKDMPVIRTFNLMGGRSFAEQLKHSKIMEHYPDMTEAVRGSLYATTKSIPEMPPAPAITDEEVHKKSFLRRAFGKETLASAPRISALEYRIAEEHDRAQRLGKRAVLLVLVPDENGVEFYQDTHKNKIVPYKPDFVFVGPDQNPYQTVENYMRANIPVVLALETTTKEPWYKKLPEQWRPGTILTHQNLYDVPFGCLLDEKIYDSENKTAADAPAKHIPDLRVIICTERPENTAPETSKQKPNLRLVRDKDTPEEPKP